MMFAAAPEAVYCRWLPRVSVYLLCDCCLPAFSLACSQDSSLWGDEVNFFICCSAALGPSQPGHARCAIDLRLPVSIFFASAVCHRTADRAYGVARAPSLTRDSLRITTSAETAACNHSNVGSAHVPSRPVAPVRGRQLATKATSLNPLAFTAVAVIGLCPRQRCALDAQLPLASDLSLSVYLSSSPAQSATRTAHGAAESGDQRAM